MTDKRGFTLIEMLIYLGLFVVLASVTASLFTQVVQLQTISRSRSQLTWQAEKVFLELSQQIKAAGSVAAPLPGASANSLSLDSGQVRYQLTSGVLEKIAGGETMALTVAPLIVESVNFINYSSTNNPVIQLKITLQLPPPMPNMAEIREGFQTSVGLRK